MVQISYASPLAPLLPFRDRRGALKVVGILELLLGGFVVFIGLLAFVGMMFMPGGSVPPAGEVATMLVACAGVGAFFMWVGVGSLRARRWVRPVILAVCWPWLAMGALTLVVLLLSLPQLIQGMRAPAATGGRPFFAGVVIGAMLVLFAYVLLPALLVALYRAEAVRATLGHYDREPRWTDRCPVPVLAVALNLVPLAVTSALYALGRPVLPAFGTALIGPPAAAGYLALAAVLLCLAWVTYRLWVTGWWVAVVLLVLWLGSSAVSMFVGGLYAAYRRAGYTDQEIEQVNGGVSGPVYGVWYVLFWGGCLCYLIYLRRFFLARPQLDSPSPQTVPNTQ